MMAKVSFTKGSLFIVLCLLLFIGAGVSPYLFSSYIEIPLYANDRMPRGLEGLLLKTKLFLLEHTIWSKHLPKPPYISGDMIRVSTGRGIYDYGMEYHVGSDIYRVMPVPNTFAKIIELPMYSFEKNGTTLATAPLCYGADFPILTSRLIDGNIALMYVEGPCEQRSFTHDRGVFFQDHIVLSTNSLPVKHVFSYDNQFGFIENYIGQVFVRFNNHMVSDYFSDIPTHSCCAPDIFPRFDLYEDGTLVFIGIRDGQYFLVRTKLQ
jgi:hypothetical protein